MEQKKKEMHDATKNEGVNELSNKNLENTSGGTVNVGMSSFSPNGYGYVAYGLDENGNPYNYSTFDKDEAISYDVNHGGSGELDYTTIDNYNKASEWGLKKFAKSRGWG